MFLKLMMDGEAASSLSINGAIYVEWLGYKGKNVPNLMDCFGSCFLAYTVLTHTSNDTYH